MAKNDLLGLQGFAQVLKGPNIGNMYALTQLKQRQQAQEAELAQKKQKEYADDFQTAIKLGDMPVMRAKITDYVTQARQLTQRGFQGLYEEGTKNQFTPQHRMFANELKNNYENAENQARGLSTTLDNFYTQTRELAPILDMQEVANQHKEIEDMSFTREQDGSLTFNQKAIVKAGEVLNQPKSYNITAMADLFKKKMGTDGMDVFTSGDVSDQRKWTNVFKLKPDGTPELDASGRPVVNDSPEAIAKWNAQGDIYERKLKQVADDKFGGDIQKAFRETVVGNYTSQKSKHYASGDGAARPVVDFALSDSKGDSFKPADEVKDGITGVTGKEVDLQQGLTKEQRKIRVTTAQGNEQEVEVQRFGVSPEGEKGIWATPLNVDGTLQEKSIFLPISKDGKDTNLMAIMNAKLKPEERRKLNDVYKQFQASKVEKTVFDEDKFKNIVTGIGEAIAGYDTTDEEATKAVKAVLVENGFPSGMDIKVDKGTFADHITIGDKTVSISKIKGLGTEAGMSEDAIEILKGAVYNSAPAKFSKKAGEQKQPSIAEKMKQAANKK